MRPRSASRGTWARPRRPIARRLPSSAWFAAVALVWACAAAVWPTSAAATEWPRRLCVLAVGPGNVGEGYVDVAEGSNGAVFLAARTGTDGYVLRLRSDGGSETVARYTGPGGALGIGADAGGAVLVLEGWGNRLSRVSSSGISQVLAGTGRPGFSGDGGPAISADIDVGFVPLAGVVRTVTGATVFTDSLNQRVRRIQPGAMIETIVGSGPAYGGLAFSCSQRAVTAGRRWPPRCVRLTTRSPRPTVG